MGNDTTVVAAWVVEILSKIFSVVEDKKLIDTRAVL